MERKASGSQSKLAEMKGLPLISPLPMGLPTGEGLAMAARTASPTLRLDMMMSRSGFPVGMSNGHREGDAGTEAKG